MLGSMQRSLCAVVLLNACGLAHGRLNSIPDLSEGPEGQILKPTFLLTQRRSNDLEWDQKTVQGPQHYKKDYIVDSSMISVVDSNKISGPAVADKSKNDGPCASAGVNNSKFAGPAVGDNRKTAGPAPAPGPAAAVAQAPWPATDTIVGGKTETSNTITSNAVTRHKVIVHSTEWYKHECNVIDWRCAQRKKSFKSFRKTHIDALEEEYRRAQKILKDEQGEHSDAKIAVDEQKHWIDEHRSKVENAKKVVKESEDCPAELKRAEEDLAKLQARPNQTPEDIDDECDLKKMILKKKTCVEKLQEAEEILQERMDDHEDGKDELKHDEHDVIHTKHSVSGQEYMVEQAKAAWDFAATQDVSIRLQEIAEECEAERNELSRIAAEVVAATEEEYLRQKKILDDAADKHEFATAIVKEEEDVITTHKMTIEETTEFIKTHKYCSEELIEAEEELDEIEVGPKDTDEEIDEECRAKKRVLKLKTCLEEVKKAEESLTKHVKHIEDMTNSVKHDKQKADQSGEVLTSQEQKVADAKASWHTAKAAERDHKC